MDKKRNKEVDDYSHKEGWKEGWQDALEEVVRQIDKQHDRAEPALYRQALAGTIRVVWSMSQESDEAMRKQNPTVTNGLYPAMSVEEQARFQKQSQFWIDGISDIDLDPKAAVNEWRSKRLKEMLKGKNVRTT